MLADAALWASVAAHAAARGSAATDRATDMAHPQRVVNVMNLQWPRRLRVTGLAAILVLLGCLSGGCTAGE